MKPKRQNPKSGARANRSRRRFGFIRLSLSLLVMVSMVYGLVAFGVKGSSNQKEAKQPENSAEAGVTGQFWPVGRGDMTISLLANGTVQAKNSTTIINRIEGDSKILWIIEEGKVVEKGDKLVELESEGLDNKIYSQKADVLRSEANYNSALQDLKLQKQDNESQLLSAEHAVRVAELSRSEYLKGTAQQEIMTRKTDITLCDLTLQRAKDKVKWTEKLLAKGYVSAGDLKADELEVKRGEISLEKAKNALEVFSSYQDVSRRLQYDNSVRETQANLDRIKQDNQFKLKNREITVESAQASLEHEKKWLKELDQQKANTVLYAPQDGMVVYANNRDRWNDVQIEVGATVRNRQKLIELPDFSSWQVETRVHESMIQQVQTGQHSLVTVDAFPDRLIDAQVAKISVMPDSGGRWFSSDVKEYIVNLYLDQPGLPLKPGMTAKSEIILDDLRNVLYVPIQCVAAKGDDSYVMVKSEAGASKRDVKVGKANDRFVEIVSGLRGGDQVMMLAQAGSAAGLMERPSSQRKEDEDGKSGAKSGQSERKGAAAKPAGERPEAAAADKREPEKRQAKAANDSSSKTEQVASAVLVTPTARPRN